MLLDDDVVADGKAEPGALSRWLGREERIEYPFSDLRWNAAAIITNSDFHAIAEILCGRLKDGFIGVIAGLTFAFRGRVETIGNQVEKYSSNLLRE